jgi:hypothetical protein
VICLLCRTGGVTYSSSIPEVFLGYSIRNSLDIPEVFLKYSVCILWYSLVFLIYSSGVPLVFLRYSFGIP